MTRGSALLAVWVIDFDRSAEQILTWARDRGLDANPPPSRLTSESVSAHRLAAYCAVRLRIAALDGFERAKRSFDVGAGGKPTLARDGISFSLAHSAGWALVAVARDACVGVDLLAMRDLALSPERGAAIEAAAIALAGGRPLSAGRPSHRTVQAWVRLEAVAKATGDGIGALLERLDIRPGRTPASERNTAGLPIAADLALPDGLFGAIAATSTAFGPEPVAVTGFPTELTRIGIPAP